MNNPGINYLDALDDSWREHHPDLLSLLRVASQAPDWPKLKDPAAVLEHIDTVLTECGLSPHARTDVHATLFVTLHVSLGQRALDSLLREGPRRFDDLRGALTSFRAWWSQNAEFVDDADSRDVISAMDVLLARVERTARHALVTGEPHGATTVLRKAGLMPVTRGRGRPSKREILRFANEWLELSGVRDRDDRAELLRAIGVISRREE